MHLQTQEKWAILVHYYMYFDVGKNKLQYGAMTLITARYGVSESTVRNIVQAYNEKINNHERYPDLSPRMSGRVGPDSQLTPELADCIVEFNSIEGYKMTVIEFTQVFNGIVEKTIPIATMHEYMHQLHGMMCNSFMNPVLTRQHRIDRVSFILRKLVPDNHDAFLFRPQLNVIHIDEKWFYVDRVSRKYREFPGEVRHPDATCIHKSHIEKVMFVVVVGVPQNIPGGGFFDGKIGVYPVIRHAVAIKSSKNRPAGTPTD
jgi:hypothetical protein